MPAWVLLCNMFLTVFLVAHIFTFCFQKLKSTTVAVCETEMMTKNFFEMCNFCMKWCWIIGDVKVGADVYFVFLFSLSMSESDKPSTWTIYINRKPKLFCAVTIFFCHAYFQQRCLCVELNVLWTPSLFQLQATVHRFNFKFTQKAYCTTEKEQWCLCSL